jgi:hypothetical protein
MIELGKEADGTRRCGVSRLSVLYGRATDIRWRAAIRGRRCAGHHLSHECTRCARACGVMPNIDESRRPTTMIEMPVLVVVDQH